MTCQPPTFFDLWDISTQSCLSLLAGGDLGRTDLYLFSTAVQEIRVTYKENFQYNIMGEKKLPLIIGENFNVRYNFSRQWNTVKPPASNYGRWSYRPHNLGQNIASLANRKCRDLPLDWNVLFMWKVNFGKKSRTSHREISVSCTTEECDHVTTPHYIFVPLSAKWSL